jgi:hypothetical protein
MAERQCLTSDCAPDEQDVRADAARPFARAGIGGLIRETGVFIIIVNYVYMAPGPRAGPP